MLQIEHVSKRYRHSGREVTALDDVSLTVPDGAVYGIAGRSGAGKSTLLRVITVLQRPNSGRVVLDGRDLVTLRRSELRRERRRIGVVFQQFGLLHGRTARENVEFPLEVAGVGRVERRRRSGELLELVGLEDRADNLPSQLSGGQKQRVGIARALASDPSVLLSDESTSALDTETTSQVLDLLDRVNRELGVSIVLITHELDILRRHATHIAAFEDGRVVEDAPVLDLVEDATSTIGRALLPRLSARPATGPTRRLIVTVRGAASSAYLSDLTLRAGRRIDVVAGGTFDVGRTTIARHEIETVGDDEVRALVLASATISTSGAAPTDVVRVEEA